MSAYKQLIDVSNNFEHQLRQVSTKLFSASIGEPFEDCISKKLQDLILLNSKLRLLRAKPIFSQVSNQPKSEETLEEYGELASWKVLEHMIVKSLTQAHSVRALMTAPDHTLDPVLAERKEKIINALKEYRYQENQLNAIETMYRMRQQELLSTRMEWDRQLVEMRSMREQIGEDNVDDNMGPMYKKLRALVYKLELMRWVIGRVVTSRGGRDCLADTKRTMRAVRLARTHNTIDMFTA